VLTIAGSADTIVPAELSRQLHEVVAGPKRYVEYPGAGHNDWEIAAGPGMLDEVARFVEEHVGG
jgi:pimeloyl-ACP methyl ester carboxylesterase